MYGKNVVAACNCSLVRLSVGKAVTCFGFRLFEYTLFHGQGFPSIVRVEAKKSRAGLTHDDNSSFLSPPRKPSVVQFGRFVCSVGGRPLHFRESPSCETTMLHVVRIAVLALLAACSTQAFAPASSNTGRTSTSLGVAIDTSDIKNGLTIELDGEPYKVRRTARWACTWHCTRLKYAH